jgi:hypothetical protein
MLKRLVDSLGLHQEVPELYRLTEEEYTPQYTAKMFLRDFLFFRIRFFEKRFQNRVLFPYLGINTPFTVRATDFNDEFYPLFIKNTVATHFVSNSAELDTYRDSGWFQYAIIQQYIQVSTVTPSYIRLVLKTLQRNDNETIEGAAVLYSQEVGKFWSNPKKGGVIPLTGQDSQGHLSEFEIQILRNLDIDPKHPSVPLDILNSVFNLRDNDGRRLYDFLHLLDYHVGIDVVYGIPFSFNQSSTYNPEWYFLELQHGPDNRFLHEANAWIGE